MLLIAIIALVLLGTAVALFARVAVMPRMKVAERLRQIDEYGFAPAAAAAIPAPDASLPPATGRLEPLANRLGELAMSRLGSNPEALRKDLRAAGLYRITPRVLIGYQVIAAIALPFLILYAALGSGKFSAVNVLLAICGGLGGWMIPVTLVRRRARLRGELIDRAMPELVDLLVVTVEAGLSFSSSLAMATDRLHGPLGDELRLVAQEQSMGLSTSEALVNLLDRCDTPVMRSFVRTTTQGESLGVSIGIMMRNLARDMRIRRRKAAEERAQRAPVKMLFPLIFLIFPSMFLVLLGPAVIQTLHLFKG